ncbi:MAG: endolytic transglycosylase MltG [Clostridiales bacterium]|nr:endolytic transglycosylase MltG [Clostridiales bacterium]
MTKKPKTGIIIALIFLLIFVFGLGAAYFYLRGWLENVAGQFQASASAQPIIIEEDVIIEIPSGSGSAAISKLLYEAGLTQSSEIFRSYARQAGIDVQLRAGEYLFSAGTWGLEDIGDLLVKGGNISHDIRVTIPEGLTSAAIALRFAEAGLCDADDFLRYVEEGVFTQSYLPASGASIAPGTRLEGFLAPDTYMVNPEWGEKQIINMLLDQFARIWTQEYQTRADELGMSALEVVTLASIIEKEAVVAEDRPIISGVFHRRLELDMLLQSCATIQFLLGEPKVPLLNSDLEVESPYNTYKYGGLPPGPIAAPGVASLQAALWPTDTDYLYFRAQNDGSHRFSKTYQEHMKKQPNDQQ